VGKYYKTAYFTIGVGQRGGNEKDISAQRDEIDDIILVG
jgi:hypothetical protein